MKKYTKNSHNEIWELWLKLFFCWEKIDIKNLFWSQADGGGSRCWHWMDEKSVRSACITPSNSYWYHFQPLHIPCWLRLDGIEIAGDFSSHPHTMKNIKFSSTLPTNKCFSLVRVLIINDINSSRINNTGKKTHTYLMREFQFAYTKSCHWSRSEIDPARHDQITRRRLLALCCSLLNRLARGDFRWFAWFIYDVYILFKMKKKEI